MCIYMYLNIYNYKCNNSILKTVSRLTTKSVNASKHTPTIPIAPYSTHISPLMPLIHSSRHHPPSAPATLYGELFASRRWIGLPCVKRSNAVCRPPNPSSSSFPCQLLFRLAFFHVLLMLLSFIFLVSPSRRSSAVLSRSLSGPSRPMRWTEDGHLGSV